MVTPESSAVHASNSACLWAVHSGDQAETRQKAAWIAVNVGAKNPASDSLLDRSETSDTAHFSGMRLTADNPLR